MAEQYQPSSIEGFSYDTYLPLWSCETCGAVVADNFIETHWDWHESRRDSQESPQGVDTPRTGI